MVLLGCSSLLQGFCIVTICYLRLRLWQQNRRMKKAQFQLNPALDPTMMHCWFEWSYYWWGDTTSKHTRNLTPPLFSPISSLQQKYKSMSAKEKKKFSFYVIQTAIVYFIPLFIIVAVYLVPPWEHITPLKMGQVKAVTIC